MPINTGNFGELLEPGIRLIYGNAYKTYPEQYTKIFTVINSSKATEYTLSMSGFGLIPTKSEGASVEYDSAIQGFKNSITHVTYGKGFMVSSEMMEDDQYGEIKRLPKALARSVRVTVEQTAADVFNRAFNSSYTATSDSKEMCATDHPLIGGGTYANELTTSADFSQTSLQQALIDIGDMVDDRGMLLNANPAMVVGPSELATTFKVILGSTLDPDSANNAINPYKGIMPFEINNYLTDPDAWFILTDVPDGPTFYWRRKPAFTRDGDFDSETAKWKVVFRMSVGWTDPRGVFGSPGA